MEIDYEPGSVTDSGFVADFDSAIDFGSAVEERSQPTILRLVVGSSRQYGKWKYSMYMNTASVGNISGNVQIPHN